MNNWFQPPEFNYSVKSHLSYPSPPPINAAANAAAEAASAGASAGVNAGAAGAGGHPPYGPRGFYSHGHGHGYGRHHWRPRFGIFRRVVWFGLGVGAASWYIHHKEKDQEVRRTIMSSWHHPTPAAPSPSLASINEHKQAPVQWLAAPPSTPVVVQETTPEKESQAEVPKWGWGAGRRERREHRLEPVQQPWSERKQDMASMKQEADEKTRRYAKEKLEVLTKALDKLRDALDEDATRKERKMV